MYGLIQICGDDATAFLQGQLTQDVTRLQAAISLPAAWCNAKGRVITSLRLLVLQDAIGLVVPASLVTAVVQKLTLYRLRSDVSIEPSNGNWTCIAVNDVDAFERLQGAGLLPDANSVCSDGALIAVDYSATERFIEIFGCSDAFGNAGLTFDSTLSDEQRAVMKIRAGLVEITSENTEKYTPHMLNLDLTGAVSFDKGCYTGQEIVARTEHLGNSRRRLMHYLSETPIAAIGDRLSCNDQPAAEVVNVAGRELLALGPVAQHGQTLQFRGTVVSPADLPYAIPVPPD